MDTESRRGTRTMGQRWIGAALVALFAFAGCSAGQPSATPVPETGVAETSVAAASETPSAAPVAALEVGNCTGPVDLTGASISSLTSQPCAQAHYYEVHARIPLTGDVYPGAEVLGEQAKTQCSPSFVEYVGVEPQYSRYTSAYLVPDEAAWAVAENRVITCLAGSAEGGLLGSAKGDVMVFPDKGECTGKQDVAALEVAILDCSSAHNYEVFATQIVKSKKAPTDKQLDKLYSDVCVAGFTKFVGVSVGKSKYEISYFIASSEVWTKVADHRIVCSAGLPAGGIKGSLKGVKK